MERVEQVAPHRRAGADPRRDRLGQGGGRARDPRALARARRAVRARQLRRDPARAGRLRAVRPRARQLHRRGRDAQGLVRARRRRHAVPRRDRRAAAGGAGAPAARAAGRHRSSASAASSAITVDVRIVAATHRDLETMVADGHVPRGPLVPASACSRSGCRRCASASRTSRALAAHFARRAGQRLGGSAARRRPSDDIALLRGYAWPGNVRELAAVIERAAILGDGTPARGRQGARHRRGAAAPARRCAPLRVRRDGGRSRRGEGHACADRRRSTTPWPRTSSARSQRRTGASRGRSARPSVLGINPHTLRARMRKLRIEWSRYRGAGDGEPAR